MPGLEDFSRHNPRAAAVLAVERERLSEAMRRISGESPNDQVGVLAVLCAQTCGYLCGAMTDATPGAYYTTEAIAGWIGSLMNEHLRTSHGRSV